MATASPAPQPAGSDSVKGSNPSTEERAALSNQNQIEVGDDSVDGYSAFRSDMYLSCSIPFVDTGRLPRYRMFWLMGEGCTCIVRVRRRRWLRVSSSISMRMGGMYELGCGGSVNRQRVLMVTTGRRYHAYKSGRECFLIPCNRTGGRSSD